MPFRVIPDTAIPGAGKGTPQTKMPAAAGAGASPVHVCTDSIRNPNGSSAVYSCHGLLNHPSIPGLAESLYGSPGFRPTPGLIPLGTRDGSAFYSPLTSVPYDVKDSIEVWRGLTQAGPCFPYDSTMAVYPYGTGYAGIDLNARRKNATRETTTTLKAWLYEHRKNPYPTKGEKIMLAIITKMTLTQVSTWFANARRRLKKENKMTWSPRNRSDDDENDDDFDRDYKKDEPDLRVDDDEENCEEKEISITDADTDNGSRVNMPVHDFKDNETSNSSFENIDDDKIDDEKGMDLTMNVKKKDESEKPISSNTEDCLDSGKLDRTSVSGSSLKLLSTVKIRRDSQQNVPTARPKIWSVSQLLDKSPDDKISEDAQVSSEQTKSLHRLGLGSSLSEVPRISGSSIRMLHSLSMARSHPYPFQMNSFLPSGFPSSVGDSERSLFRQTLPFSSSRSIMKH